MQNAAVEMAERLIVDSIWKSANLEGLGTTFPSTEMILDNIPVKTSREEVLFIINMKQAWNFLLSNVDYSNSLAFIRELNKLCGNNLFYGAGDLRTINVSIGGTSWVPSIPVHGDIYSAINQIELIEDPIERALEYFCFLSRSQLFIDGNKRVAQLMANKVLIEKNVGVFQIGIDLIEEFKLSLIDFYETNNSTEIKSLMRSHCIQRVGVPLESRESDIFSLKVSPENITVSQQDLYKLRKILKNLINLCIREHLYGTAELKEENGDFILTTVSKKFCVKYGELNQQFNSKDRTVESYMVKTGDLISRAFTLPIKSVKFPISSRQFKEGIIRESENEQGSLSIELR